MTSPIRVVVSVLALAAIALLPACEDDPILEPTPDDDTGGGSYGVISFPGSAGAAEPITNPAIF